METGSSGGGGRRPGDDAHGLNFGKKIYFEQDASGGSGSSGGGGGGGRKGKGVAASGGPAGGGAGGQQPRCQVAGCGVDLTGVKGYYCRHKVCKMHAKAPVVVVAGIEQRFCQQCSRFHQVTEFDQGKRSCRRRLAGHNERRRKPPPGPASRYGRLSTSLQEDPGRLRSFLLDFSYPRAPSSVRDPWPTIQPGDYHMPGTTYWQGSSHEHHPQRSAVVGYGDHHAYTTGQGSSSGGGGGAPMIPTYELPSGEHIAGVAADSSCALSLLSTQPWDTSTHTASHNNRSPAMSTTSAFQGSPVAPSVVASNYMAASSSGSWGSPRGHGGARNMQQHHHHHLTHDTVMTEVHPHHHGQFGELELALQQGRAAQNPPDGEHGSGSGGAFSHSSNAMNWSL